MENSNKPVSDLYIVSRSHIQHYLLSIESRLVWTMNIQAFMLGIYAATTFYVPPTPHLKVQAHLLNIVITYLGVSINLFTLIDTVAGVFRMNTLRNNYVKGNNGQDKELDYPALYGSATDRILQGFSPILTVFTFMILWSFLVLYDHNIIKL